MKTTHSPHAVPEVPGYVELQRQVHHALLAQHPEWILPDGEAPICDSYDARFAELLSQLRLRTSRRLAPARIGSSYVQLQLA